MTEKDKQRVPPQSEREPTKPIDDEAEERLDEALKESFPASDPIAPFREG